MTPLRNRILILLLGIFFAIFILEIGLIGLELGYSFMQEFNNSVSLSQKKICRILCLGESMTAPGGGGTYTDKLENILNQAGIGIKFKVINKGAIGVNSSYILAHLEENLQKYKPNIVITMMGINDKGVRYYEGIEDSSILFTHCKTYRLLKTLWKQLFDKALKGKGDIFLTGRKSIKETIALAADPVENKITSIQNKEIRVADQRHMKSMLKLPRFLNQKAI